MKKKIQNIRIDQIRIINPRVRDKQKFELIIQSIRDVGLKKPIKVSRRLKEQGEEPGYDLVCGQGRIEAFQALGYEEIPADVIEVPKEERLLMSLVENIARRFPSPMDLIREIERLKEQGYSNKAIAKKLAVGDKTIAGLLQLNRSGEERLLYAFLRGKISMRIAIAIAKADGIETQRQILSAHEKEGLSFEAIRAMRRLVEQRSFLGKTFVNGDPITKARTSADGLVHAYKKEAHRQKLMVKKAKICEAKLLFVVNAIRQLRKDENFINLLRAEKLDSLPKQLA